jgi:cysteine desulfurase family protein
MEDLIYLDNAATTFPKPSVMHDAARDFYLTSGVNPGRSGTDMALGAEQMIQGVRKKLSALFNPGKPKDPNRLGFTLNATMAINLILDGTVRAGDHVVTTMLEHNSVIRPVNHLVKRGAEATFVAPDPEGYLDPEEIRKAVKSNTKLVMVNHASNVTGVVQDLKAIGKVCREEGVPFAVDAAQSAGVLPIDMAQRNISFVAFTGHKGLLGPSGTGGVCVADDAEIEGSVFGGTGVRSASRYHLTEFPYRLEAGTLNLMGIAGLSAALAWLEEQGIEQIHRREIELLKLLQDGLGEIKGVSIQGTRKLENRVATMSLTVDNYDAEDVGTILDVDFGIVTRTGLHCSPLLHEHHGTAPRGTVRISLGPFNTKEHIEACIRAIAEIAADRN